MTQNTRCPACGCPDVVEVRTIEDLNIVEVSCLCSDVAGYYRDNGMEPDSDLPCHCTMPPVLIDCRASAQPCGRRIVGWDR